MACCALAVLVASSCSSGTRQAGPSTSTTGTQATVRTTSTLAPTTTHGGPLTTTSVAQPPPTAFATGLAVVACPTEQALTSQTPPSTIVPPTGLPPNVSSQLAIYTDTTGRTAVLAPRGWSCRAAFGADGSGGISVFPAKDEPTTRGPTPADQIAAGTDGGCAGCTLATVCASFPDLAEPGVACRPRIARESVTRLGTHLVGLFAPPGVRGPNPANGVMIVQESPGLLDDWYEECTLPPSEHALCTAILNDFVRMHPPN
jgi:hypothetical protein